MLQTVPGTFRPSMVSIVIGTMSILKVSRPFLPQIESSQGGRNLTKNPMSRQDFWLDKGITVNPA